MELLRSLQITLAEEVLSVSGLVLLLVAAWGGDKAARLISILSVAVLAVCALIAAPALCGSAMGPDVSAFAGQYRADAFAAFAKLLIYAGAGVTLIVAPAFFERARGMRAEFPILVLFAALGMGIMVSADRPAHALHRSRTQQPCLLCAGLDAAQR
jgi:NADH-quinone oxidoreductase subunit N